MRDLIDEHERPVNKDQKTRMAWLQDGIIQEIAARATMGDMMTAEYIDFQDVHKRTSRPHDSDPHQKWRDRAPKHLQTFSKEFKSRLRTFYVTMSTLDIFATPKGPQNDYNKPMPESERALLNAAAASTLEGVQILKSYGVAPMVIPAKAVRLPVDIAIHPPLPTTEGKTEDGILAEFFLLNPNDNRQTDTLVQKVKTEDGQLAIMAGDNEIAMWLRLYDNGQIITGDYVKNIPNDHLLKQFATLGSEISYERLRALLISIAYDAVVPEEIVREQTGGSVAARFGRKSPTPNQESITDIVLQRQRVLRQAKVSPENREPSGWEWPKRVIGGYMRRLPEGYKPRATAEDEAREYYDRLKIEFNGLPEGMNFISEFTRGTMPPRTDYRRAHFRPGSRTRKFFKKKK